MKKVLALFLCVCAVTILTVYTSKTIADNHSAKVEQPLDFEKNWHYWRGPLATGEAVNGNPPTTWSEAENIRWKVPIPGLGHATPIIWKDKIYIQTAIQGETVKPETTEEEKPPEEPQQRRRGRRGNRNRTLPTFKYDLLALNRSDGSVAWQKTLRVSKPHEGIHGDASFASNSPITDGVHIYAYFGSRGLYCLDMAGNIKWEKDIGIMRKRNAFGEGAAAR